MRRQRLVAHVDLTVVGGHHERRTDRQTVEQIRHQSVRRGHLGDRDYTRDLGVGAVRTLLDANVVAPLRLAQALAQAGTGRAIVNVSSINGRSAEEHFADYNASKAALISLTQSLAIDLAPRGIRCNAVCPGYTATEMTEPYLADSTTRTRIESAIPLGRVGRAEEVADAIAFLLSEHASYITGEALVVDGGRLSGWVGSA